MACKIFDINNNEHTSEVGLYIRNAIKHWNKTDVKSLVDTFISKLKSKDQYSLDSDTEMLSLSKFFGETLSSSKVLQKNPEALAKAKSEYLSLLYRALNRETRPEVLDNSKSLPEEINNEQVNSEIKVFSTKMDNMYGDATIVKEYMLNNFRRNIIEAALINFKTGLRIKTNYQLNELIAAYKNRLFESLVDYITDEYPGLELNNILYDKNGDPDLKALDSALKYATDLFNKNTSREDIGLAFLLRNKKVGDSFVNKNKVDAFNAFVLLSGNNFDFVFNKLLGKNFSVSRVYRGEVPISKLKYKFASGNSFRNSWGGSENVDAITEIGNLSKLLIEQTPLYSYLTKTQIPDSYVTLKLFMYTMNKLQDPVIINKLNNNPKLLQILDNFKDNPNANLLLALKLILALTINNPFSLSDLDLFYSIYLKFYRDEQGEEYSLWQIMKMNLDNLHTEYDILESIAGVVARTNAAVYALYAEDLEFGDMVAKEIKQSNLTGKRLQRETDMRVSTKLRSNRLAIIDKYKIETNNSDIAGRVQFTIRLNNGKFITLKYDKTKRARQELQVINGNLKLSDLEEPKMSDLKDYYERNANNSKLQSDGILFYLKLIEFVDDMLFTGFLNGNIDLLTAFKNLYLTSQRTSYLTSDLLRLASHAALVNVIYNEFDKAKGEEDIDLATFARDNYSLYNKANLDGEFKYYYNNRSESLNAIVTDSKGLTILDKLALAELTINGEIYKTVTKNAIGNNIPNNRIANLANQTRYYILSRIRNNENSAIKDCLFNSNINAIKGVLVKTDIISRNGVKKVASKFTESEHTYSAIMLDFYANLLNNNYVLVLPTVYSDKETFYMWKIANELNINGSKLNLLTSQLSEFDNAIKSTIGNTYKKVYNKVYEDYRKVYTPDFILTIIAQSKPYNVDLSSIIGKTSDLLTNSEINLLLSVTPLELYNEQSYKLGVHNIENLHINSGTASLVELTNKGKPRMKNGEVVLSGKKVTVVKPNTLLIYNATLLYANDEIYNLLMLREKKKFIRDIINNNVKFPTIYLDNTQNKILDKLTDKLPNGNEWINSNTLELIIAKRYTINEKGNKEYGNIIDRLNPLTDSDIRNGSLVELNPILERFFLSDFLLSENLRIITTGLELAHPDKRSKEFTSKNPVDDAEFEEATRGGALNKRNVIIPGTKQDFLLNSIVGIPPKLRVAVVEDTRAPVFNLSGRKNNIQAHDGSSFTNPLWSVLENLSMQDSAVGEDKKPIGHDYTDYGTAVLLKFATFSLYNERMRKSLLSPINMYDVFRKTNSISWTSVNDNNPVNITRNLYGKPLLLKDILGSNRLYYRNGNRYFEITAISPVINTETNEWYSNSYNIFKLEVDSHNNIIGKPFIELVNDVDTNFLLFNMLGGIYSVSFNPNTNSFNWSDSSIHATVGYINNVGHYTGTNIDLNGKILDYLDLKNTKLPLKNAMIGYITNKSAMKVGAEYINNTDVLTDGNKEFKYMIINTDGLGIQMDADHIVTDPQHLSTLTEFSLVISALEANGTAHEISRKAYRDLGKVALNSIADIDLAIKEFIDSDFLPEGKSNIYEEFGRLIIKEFNKDSKDLGLSTSIITKVLLEFNKHRKNHKDDEFKMPFSDPSIFGKALASFTSAINNTAIKRKFPGMGAVMCPAYNIMTNFVIDGRNYSYDDIYDEAANANMTVTEWLDAKLLESDSKGPITVDKALPCELYKVYDKEANTTTIYNLNDFESYTKFKDEFGKDKYEIYRVVNLPRNLKPAEVYWTVNENGKEVLYNLFDLPVVKSAFKLRLKGITKELEKLLLNNINNALRMIDLGKMPIDKKNYKEITSGSLVSNAAEMIVSKLYSGLFNLNQSDSIGKIKDASFFVNKLHESDKATISQYDFYFTKANGEHTYIAFKDSPVVTSLLNPLVANKKLEAEDFRRIGNDMWRVDSNGKKIYRAGEFKQSENNTEVYEEYISSYISRDNYEDTEVLVVNSPETALELWSPKIYNSILFKQEAKQAAPKVYEMLTLGKNVAGISRYYRNALVSKESSLFLKWNDFILKLNIINNERRIKRANLMYASFLKSLEFTVARIPAQTLQSFMKMKAVQFADTDKNIVYVSHFQTWLQGSDYDIDKAYIMGHDFDLNGNYIGWSPFFNYDSDINLKKSEQLPTPNGKVYESSNDEDALNITNEILTLRNLSDDNMQEILESPEALDILVDLLNKVDEHPNTKLTYNIYVVKDLDFTDVLNAINEHNGYMTVKYKDGKIVKNSRTINTNDIVAAFRNAVSSKIESIILDVKNFNSAYTPINMDDPLNAAANSPLGKEANRITYTSPTSKYLMTVLNMDGKSVIGISAVAEKIFFAASYYYNEAVRSGNPEWIRNAFFSKIYDKIEKNNEGVTIPTLRNIIANVNFVDKNSEEWKKLVRKAAEGMSDEDIKRTLETLFGLLSDLSLIISALLSAATDNAKELILSKINAGPELAGIYLHLTMLNYKFSDIVDFMTSSTVQVINDLTKTNVFDDYNDTQMGKVDSALIKLTYGPKITQYITSNNIMSILYEYKKKHGKPLSFVFNDNFINITTPSAFLMYLRATFLDGLNMNDTRDELSDIFDLVRNPNTKREINRFVEEFLYLKNKRNSIDLEVLEEFRKIRDDAKETTTLGRLFGLNQGMATDIAGKISFLDAIELVVTRTLEKYNTTNANSFVDSVINNKSYLAGQESYIESAYNNAKKLGIIDNFDALLFLNPQNIEYRLATIDYYNCIKKIWNVFDMIDKIPHFKALYDVLNLTELATTSVINKYRLVRNFKKKLGGFFDELKINGLAQAIDELLIINWLEGENISFTLNEGDTYFDKDGNRLITPDKLGFNLASDDGRATFKLWMETKVVPELKAGRLEGKLKFGLSNNKFISSLRMDERIDGFTKNIVNYLKLPIDMMNIKTESDQNRFAQYESSLKDLSKHYILGRSLLDWFFLYNLIVNQNRFGPNNLTTIFKNFLLNNNIDTILLNYLKSVGEMDYNMEFNEDNVDLEDILIKLSPIVAKNKVSEANDLYIRIYNNDIGAYVIYKKNTGGSNNIDMEYYDEEGTNNIDNYAPIFGIDKEKLQDYYNYFIIRSPMLTDKIKLLFIDKDSNLEDILGSIRNLMKRNTLQINIKCE